MPPRWPVTKIPGQIDVPGNDNRHNSTDPNQGGGPRGGKGFRGNVPPSNRGGFGHQGRDRVHGGAAMTRGRSGSGNPAGRGGFSGEARGGAFKPEARVSGHGGSPQHRGGAGSGAQFGKPGQRGVPGGNPTHGPAGAGNTSGRSAKLIAGRFNRKAMGASASQGDSMGGRFGGPPVSTNT